MGVSLLFHLLLPHVDSIHPQSTQTSWNQRPHRPTCRLWCHHWRRRPVPCWQRGAVRQCWVGRPQVLDWHGTLTCLVGREPNKTSKHVVNNGNGLTKAGYIYIYSNGYYNYGSMVVEQRPKNHGFFLLRFNDNMVKCNNESTIMVRFHVEYSR